MSLIQCQGLLPVRKEKEKSEHECESESFCQQMKLFSCLVLRMNEEGGQRKTLVLRTMQPQVPIPLPEALDGNDSLSRRVIRSTVGDG